MKTQRPLTSRMGAVLVIIAMQGIASGQLDLWLPNGSHIYNINSGNVGIGTTSPSEKLHINGSVRGNQSGALRISTGYGYVDVGPKNTAWTHFYTDRARYYFNTGITVDTGLLGSYNENLYLQTSGTTRMTILNSNGYVGFGTSSPGQKLDIVENANAVKYLEYNSQNTDTNADAAKEVFNEIHPAARFAPVLAYYRSPHPGPRKPARHPLDPHLR